MSEKKSHKKRKIEASSEVVAQATISDPRFASLQSDPRYRLPGKRHKVKVDSRFSQALKDDDFSRRAKVDRYGRPLDTDAERKRLKRKYDFEEDDRGEESDEADDDDVVQQELRKANEARDVLREGKYSDSSSSSSSSGDEDSGSEENEAEEAELAPQTQSNVPTGEVSSRLAVVNLDWDNIRAQDLMAVFSSFLDAGGQLKHVAVYPSEFGKERLQREEMGGPPPEIFASTRDDVHIDSNSDLSASESEDDEEAIKRSMLKPDDGADFDSQALRRYQLERLQYFYAILTFSSPPAAKRIYDAVDGTEYLSTANFFDLRFVPDETDFSTDTPREECTGVPADYKPNEFVTDALQHSKVKLTWDEEDTGRKEAQARAFRGGQKEIDENDLKAYLGSDSSSADESEVEVVDITAANNDASAVAQSKKYSSRARMREMLGLKSEATSTSKSSKKDKAPVGNVQITFSAGLSSNNTDDKKRSVFVNTEEEANETTLEKYVRKEKERKQKRRDRAKIPRTGEELAAESDEDAGEAMGITIPADKEDEDGDQGFDDPFFTAPTTDATAADSKTKATKLRKEERLKKRREREEEEEKSAKQRAELESLMADDADDHDAAEGHDGVDGRKGKMRHFDMRDIEKAEKLERKKSKSKKEKKRQKRDANKAGRQPDTVRTSETVGGTDDFQLDTNDPRFTTRLFSNHEFAIDPTNPRYKETRGMQALMEEGRRRKKHSGRSKDKGVGDGGAEDADGKDGGNRKGGDDFGGTKALAEKLKRKQRG